MFTSQTSSLTRGQRLNARMGWRVFVPLVFIPISSVFTSLSSAQSTEPSAPTIRVQFRTLASEASISGLNFSKDKKDTGVTIESESRSIFYDYTGSALLAFYRMEPGAEGKPERILAAEADVSASGPWPLLVFSSDPKDSKKFNVKVIADDLKALPMGGFNFVNDTALALSAVFGDESLTLAPRQSTVIRATSAADQTTRLLQVYRREGNSRMLLYSNNWALRPSTRTLVFAGQNSTAPGKLVVRRVMESADVLAEQLKRNATKP